jgi:hypothetical protein
VVVVVLILIAPAEPTDPQASLASALRQKAVENGND